MNKFKRILKILLRIGGVLLVILLLMAAILQIPAVQQYVTEGLENYLQKKFKTEVNIQSIRLKLPESLALKGVYIEDDLQDTLLNVEELLINFKLNQLLQKRIQFDYISLAHGKANLHWAKDSSNIDFILDAFNVNPRTAPQPTSIKDSTSTPWLMTFDHSELLLQDIDFQFSDETIVFTTHLGTLLGAVGEIDYLHHNYMLDQIYLSDSYGALERRTSDLAKKQKGLSEDHYDINANYISLKNVLIDLKMPDLALSTKITELENQNLLFSLTGDTMNITSPMLKIKDSDFRLDRASTKKTTGFDFNHFGLTNTNTKITDFTYKDFSINGNIVYFSAADDNGFLVKELQTEIDFSKEQISLQNLSLKTKESRIQSAKTNIQYPFFNASTSKLSQLKIEAKVNAYSSSLSDIRYFYPLLDSIPFLQNVPDTSLNLKATVNGSLANLKISSFNFEGLNTKLNAFGTIKNATNPAKMGLDVTVDEMVTSGRNIATILPAGTLPDFMKLPDIIRLTGKINGTLQNFKSTLNATTTRIGVPIVTQINGHASAQNVVDWQNAFLDIQLDTFRTSKADVLSYLPNGAIPDYVQLPDQLVLSGQISGPATNLSSNFSLLTYRNNEANEIKVLGRISGLFTGGKPVFDLSLNAAQISRQEIAALLPDSLLPAYFRLPFIKKLTGIIKGDLNNFKTNFQLESNTGTWTVDASLNDQQYELDLRVVDLDPDSFFSEEYLDSLLGISFLPWSVNMVLSGKGFDTSKKSSAKFDMTIKSKSDPYSKGLVLSAKMDEQKITAKAIANEEEITLASNLMVDLTKRIPLWQIDMLVDQLDLQKIAGYDAPFAVNGRLIGEVEGNSFDTLLGQLLFSDIGILYQDSTEQVDSLLIAANFDNGNNLVKITSDFLDAKLEGVFQYPRIMSVLQQQFYNYWKYEYPDSLIGATKDFFNIEFDLHRPEILTMGFIPELEELAPFTGRSKYDNQNALILLKSVIPHIRYQKMTFEDLSVQIEGEGKELDYQLSARQALIQEAADIERVSLSGKLQNRSVQNTIQILDERNEKRFLLASTFDFLKGEGLRFSMAPEQLLNYQEWSVRKSNAVVWAEEKLSVQNWRFFTNKQAIEIKDKGEEQFEVLFDHIDLKSFSDLLKLKSNFLRGILNGNLAITNPIKEPRFSSQLTIDDLVFLNAKLGDLRLNAENQKDRIIQAEAKLLGNGNDISINGHINPGDKLDPLDLQMIIPNLSLQSVEPLMNGYLENMKGTLHGAVNIIGSLSNPALIGQVQFDTAALDITLAKTRFYLGNQPVVFDANAIEFKNLEIKDAKGNKGIMSSFILTENYRDFHLLADLSVKDFIVLNTTEKDNDLYYGKLQVDAVAKLSGDILEPTIEVTATPQKNSELTYVYSVYSNTIESHEGIVEFVGVEEKRKKENDKRLKFSSDLNMNITVKIAVNDNLSFKAITDPISGDYFLGKVKGDLVYVQKPGGIIELNGNLETVEGKYLFTYQKVIRRPFEVEPGGTISWTGDPFTPKLNFNVIYKIRASVYPLLSVQNGAGDPGGSGIPKQLFVVKLTIGGTPAKTDIKSTIEYPRTDGNANNSEVEAAINRINLNVSQQNTQAFSLILFGGFVSQGFENSGFQLVNVSGSINGVITQQLNSIANRYIKFVELDFGLNSYENFNNNAQTDFRVSIRKRFLNDRLSISLDGTTSSERGMEESASQSYLDNITVEYSLTHDGRFKVKIYNKRDFDDFIGGTGVKVGGAFVFSKDFNGIRLKR